MKKVLELQSLVGSIVNVYLSFSPLLFSGHFDLIVDPSPHLMTCLRGGLFRKGYENG